MPSSKEKKQRHWLSHLSFGTVALVSAGLLVLSYLSVVVNPAKAWFFTLFGLLFPVVLPLTFALFIWSLFRRSHMRGLLLLSLLPAIFFLGRYYQFGGPQTSPEQTPSLKIVSYNVGLFAQADRGLSREVTADSVSRWLCAQGADLICLQECYFPLEAKPQAWFKQHFPGYDAHYYILTGENGHFGNAILSRRPVSDKGKIAFEKSTNMALWADVKLDSSTLRLYNCHFESYNISLSKLVKDDDGMDMAERKMRRSISERPKQVDEVLKGIQQAPFRSLVLGDFNDSPLSYTYFRLCRGRKDSFVKAGKGFGATYRSLWPLLRIDYILYPSNLEAASCDIPHVHYSDHYPVISTYYESRRDSR